MIIIANQIHPTVLNNVMRGQVWSGGTRYFHSNIRIPSLIVHGESDPFVSFEENEAMFKVCAFSRTTLTQLTVRAITGQGQKSSINITSFLKENCDKGPTEKLLIALRGM